MKVHIGQFEDGFGRAQDKFGGKIDTSDYSSGIHSASVDEVRIFGEEKAGFHRVDAGQQSLPALIGKILLMPNGGNFSPVIFTKNQGRTEVTRLEIPFVPGHGVTDGIDFALSAKAQTRTNSFGGHNGAGGFEAGHISTALAGASVAGRDIANDLRTSGHKAAHRVIDGGVTETMSALNMLDIPYKTVMLPDMLQNPLPVFWHRSLEDGSGVKVGNFPDAVKLMLGAGVAAIGESGLVRAERLIDETIRDI